MQDKKIKQELISTCTTTFEAFDYSCSIPKALGTLWELVATKFNGEKSYAIVCAPRVDAIRNNIRIAQKKLDDDTRLVVVTEELSAEEVDASLENDYSLITISEIKRFGLEMVEIKERDRASGREMTEDELNALISTREKVF